MQSYLVTAAALSVLIGVVHSVLGELLIFHKLRGGTLVPTHAAPPLAERHVRILWATWHVVSVFGFAFAAVLFRLGSVANATTASIQSAVLTAISVAFLGASILVLVATKGHHPGWLGLATASALVAWAGHAT